MLHSLLHASCAFWSCDDSAGYPNIVPGWVWIAAAVVAAVFITFLVVMARRGR